MPRSKRRHGFFKLSSLFGDLFRHLRPGDPIPAFSKHSSKFRGFGSFTEFFELSELPSAFDGDAFPVPPRKGAAIQCTLLCSLDELYKGTTKRMKISRNVADGIGRSATVEEILTIEIKPGWRKGTRITFPKMGIRGNERLGIIPSDLVFIIDEKPHTIFKRDGNDLIITQEISIEEALTGYTAQLTTLDGRILMIPINNVISPTYEEVLKGEGMPLSKEPMKKGNLRIKFDIKFPKRLTSDQKSMIKRAFTLYK